MNFKKIGLGLVLFGLVLGIGISSSASGSFEATLDSLNSQNFPFTFSNVRVTDNGIAVTDLTADNFKCSENGIVQTDFFQVTSPQTAGGVRLADIVFLIDASGSMGSAINGVKNNVNTFADALVASDVDYRLGLVQFGQYSDSGHPQLFNSGNLTDAAQFKEFVNTLSATGGYEPGFLALRMAAQGFNFRPGAQKVFLLISDEDSDDRDKEGTITLLQTNDIVVHTAVNCAFEYSSSDYCDGTSARAATGGQSFSVQGPYSDILDSIVTQTASSYVIRYKSSNPTFDGTERAMECAITRDADQATVFGSYIPGSAPIITLSAQTEILNQNTLPENSPGAIIRAAVTDEVEPFAKSNGVWLYYRTSGSNSDYLSTMMILNGQYYEATIPIVSSPGVDYYLTATDGEQASSLPSTDPGVYPFQIAVLPNVMPNIAHEPVISAIKNKPITITATITDTTEFLQKATLKYRRMGELLYKTIEMHNTSGDTFEAIIPADDVTDDIEYYLIAKDNFNVAAYKATADEPFVIGFEIEVLPQCSDGIDNDGDGKADKDDLGCADGNDNSEWNKNTPPVLSFPDFGPYAGDGFFAHLSNFGDILTFKVIYSDADNNAPSDIFVGLEKEQRKLPMALDKDAGGVWADGDFTNGEMYVAQANDFAPGDHSFFYMASDGETSVKNIDSPEFGFNVMSKSQCSDEIDNDGDGSIDDGDAGCRIAGSQTEIADQEAKLVEALDIFKTKNDELAKQITNASSDLSVAEPYYSEQLKDGVIEFIVEFMSALPGVDDKINKSLFERMDANINKKITPTMLDEDFIRYVKLSDAEKAVLRDTLGDYFIKDQVLNEKIMLQVAADIMEAVLKDQLNEDWAEIIKVFVDTAGSIDQGYPTPHQVVVRLVEDKEQLDLSIAKVEEAVDRGDLSASEIENLISNLSSWSSGSQDMAAYYSTNAGTLYTYYKMREEDESSLSLKLADILFKGSSTVIKGAYPWTDLVFVASSLGVKMSDIFTVYEQWRESRYLLTHVMGDTAAGYPYDIVDAIDQNTRGMLDRYLDKSELSQYGGGMSVSDYSDTQFEVTVWNNGADDAMFNLQIAGQVTLDTVAFRRTYTLSQVGFRPYNGPWFEVKAGETIHFSIDKPEIYNSIRFDLLEEATDGSRKIVDSKLKTTDQEINAMFGGVVGKTISSVKKWLMHSPGELRVFDSSGRVTGLVNGEVVEEIPNSAYDKDNHLVIILEQDGSGPYHCEVVGIEKPDETTYGLTITSATAGGELTFDATDVPIVPDEVHGYSVNWQTLAQGGDGVTMQIDKEGDGVFEKSVVADKTLEASEITASNPVIPTNTGGGGGIYTAASPTDVSVAINNGNSVVENAKVNLILSASGAVQMAISNSPDFADVGWEDFKTAKEWVLSAGVGEKNVYVKFRSANGGVSSVVSDSINLTEGKVQGAATVNILDGDIIQCQSSADPFAVYIVKTVGDKKYIRHIVSPEIFNHYGHLKWGNIIQVDLLDGYSLSSRVRVSTGPNATSNAGDRVYEINGDQTRHWMNMTAERFLNRGGSDAAIYSINQGELDLYGVGADVTL